MSPSVISLLLSIAALTQPILTQRSVIHASASSATLSLSSTASIPIDISTSGTPASSMKPVSIAGHQSQSPLQTTTTSTSATPLASNIQACNGYVELCDRKLSNISMVVAHNSPFVVPHNAASNQDLGVLAQLDDGIRGLQFETHYPNATAGLHLCHTSCALLSAGPLHTYLATVARWLTTHPSEVITLIMGNNNRVPPTTYIEPFQTAGLLPYLYTPPAPNMTLNDWPTLASMILHNQRVVVMLDYLANQTAVPWLLDEFAYQWETPFSPTDPAFPCTQQRPPGQPPDLSRNTMYMLNHNLNIEMQLLGADILVPAYTLLHQVNAAAGNGSLGRNVDRCTAVWGRPPNWLLVDYYNHGDFNGSVFEVAARANGVSYDRDACCGSRPATAHGNRATRSNITCYASGVLCALLFSLVSSDMRSWGWHHGLLNALCSFLRFWMYVSLEWLEQIMESCFWRLDDGVMARISIALGMEVSIF